MNYKHDRIESMQINVDELRALRNEIQRLRAALTEARRWIGDGEFSDGLHHDYWTPEYRAAVAMVDAALVPNAPELTRAEGVGVE